MVGGRGEGGGVVGGGDGERRGGGEIGEGGGHGIIEIIENQ